MIDLGYKFTSARLIMLIVGIIALVLAIYYKQYEIVREYLTRFVKEELAGY